MKYNYWIEDGQFTREIELNKLIGSEGDIVKVPSDIYDEDVFYILYVDGNRVECIGSIERDFPKSRVEHERLKKAMIKSYQVFSDFKITYSDEFNSEFPSETIVAAYSFEEARDVFIKDYPNLEIINVESV